MRSLRGALDISTLRTVYFAYAASRIRYCIALWGCSHLAEDVLKAQKRVIRAMTGAAYLDSCRPLFKQLRILPVPCLYIFDVLVHAFNNRLNYFLCHDLHSHNTRGNNNIRLPLPTCERFRTSPDYMGPALYNRLPPVMKDIRVLSQFKTAALNLLLDKAFYSLGEFTDFLNTGRSECPNVIM